MYTVNGVLNTKSTIGTRNSPFEYAITLAPVSETITVSLPSTSFGSEHEGQQSVSESEVLCFLP